MSSQLSEVRAAVTLRLVVPRADIFVEASLRYDRDDPYAVHLSFRTPSGRDPIEWLFARSLAWDGLSQPAGVGDVRIWPSQEDPSGPVYIELCSPSGCALFAVPRPVLTEFLERSGEVVPRGDEARYIDLDAELDLLLYDDLD
jgi:Streptomyces sporulation and cell division protein, SsgA